MSFKGLFHLRLFYDSVLKRNMRQKKFRISASVARVINQKPETRAM